MNGNRKKNSLNFFSLAFFQPLFLFWLVVCVFRRYCLLLLFLLSFFVFLNLVKFFKKHFLLNDHCHSIILIRFVCHCNVLSYSIIIVVVIEKKSKIMSQSSISIDKDAFFRRIRLLYNAWKVIQFFRLF